MSSEPPHERARRVVVACAACPHRMHAPEPSSRGSARGMPARTRSLPRSKSSDHPLPTSFAARFEPWTGPAPDPERLDDQVRRAHRLPLRTPRLTTIDSARDADVLDLGDLAEPQLRIAGKTWDGQDLEAFDRLDGEREDSFGGHARAPRPRRERPAPLRRAPLRGGSGVFFRSGTTQVLGVIADHCVETTDRPARLALEQALGRDAAPAPAPAPVERVTDRVAQKQLALPIDVAPPPAPPRTRASRLRLRSTKRPKPTPKLSRGRSCAGRRRRRRRRPPRRRPPRPRRGRRRRTQEEEGRCHHEKEEGLRGQRRRVDCARRPHHRSRSCRSSSPARPSPRIVDDIVITEP